MLLSSERPFVGAFAFHIPRATLLHRNGLVRAVLPVSDWNMCKRDMNKTQPTRKGRLTRRTRAYSIAEIMELVADQHQVDSSQYVGFRSSAPGRELAASSGNNSRCGGSDSDCAATGRESTARSIVKGNTTPI
jgi:hypothetical protein